MQYLLRQELFSIKETIFHQVQLVEDFTDAQPLLSLMVEIQISLPNDQLFKHIISLNSFINQQYIDIDFLNFCQNYSLKSQNLNISDKECYQQLLNQIFYKTKMQGIALSVLISGRIYEQQSIFTLTMKTIYKFSQLCQGTFYLMDDRTYQKVSALDKNVNCKIFHKESDSSLIDFVVTIGGDGTILYAAKQFLDQSPPFLTFQQGTLGFLCKFKIQQLQTIITKAVQFKKYKQTQTQSHFQICKLMRLQGVIKKKVRQQKQLVRKIVLNQVSITRKDYNRIIVDIWVNGQRITTTAGDGMLVSTPTGSTAYALSSGGPIVFNGVNSILLVPIAPNSLSFRPICLPSNSTIRIVLNKNSRSNALVSFDGQSSAEITNQDQIQIRHVREDNKNNDLILYEPKANNDIQMPTWMNRLKYFLGWNQVFKSPKCQDLNQKIDKIQIPQCQKKTQAWQ